MGSKGNGEASLGLGANFAAGLRADVETGPAGGLGVDRAGAVGAKYPCERKWAKESYEKLRTCYMYAVFTSTEGTPLANFIYLGDKQGELWVWIRAHPSKLTSGMRVSRVSRSPPLLRLA